MRCLLTGATGFVGSWLTRRLVADGHSVGIVTRSGSDTSRINTILNNVTQIHGDLNAMADSRPSILKFAPDTVFHLGWKGGNSSRYQNDPAQVFSNVPGSLELIQIAADSGAKTFINFGSCMEYGQFNIPVRETDSVLPKNLYGSAKYAFEYLGSVLAPTLGLRFCSLRLFWAYGPSDDPSRLVPSLIRGMLDGKRHSMTMGDQIWDYLYIDDVIEAVIQVSHATSAQGIFNLGSGHPEKLRTIAEYIASLTGGESLLGLGDIPYGTGQVMHLQADTNRLRLATGWVPKVPLEDGLKRTVAWYKEQLIHGTDCRA